MCQAGGHAVGTAVRCALDKDKPASVLLEVTQECLGEQGGEEIEDHEEYDSGTNRIKGDLPLQPDEKPVRMPAPILLKPLEAHDAKDMNAPSPQPPPDPPAERLGRPEGPRREDEEAHGGAPVGKHRLNVLQLPGISQLRL